MANERDARTFLHPASGAVILALDWLLFSGNLLSLGLSTPFVSGLGFVLGSVITASIQRRYGHDRVGKSWLKGLGAGLAVGVPWPIAGTAVGGLVLTLSGLDRWKRKRLGTSSEDKPSDSPA
jgi:hypothetical protein